ncbi:iron ABC transporter permease, partial [bacterium]|nr:iron ABC transporter permease [candidate division CSSED10-310 bacterium]
MVNQRRFFRVLLLSIVFLFVCLITAPMIGPQPINIRQAWIHRSTMDSPDAIIVFSLRLPRILFAALTGSALAGAGVAFQALLRNPLATPYTLGVSSGTACGAVIGMLSGCSGLILGIPCIQLTGFAGAVATIILVYLIGRRTGDSTHTLLLAGVTLSFFFASFIMLMQYMADFTQTHRIIHWMMGGLDIADYSTCWRALPGVMIGLTVLWTRASEYNLLSAGATAAQSRGVNVQRCNHITYAAASLIVAAVVSVTGPIGFVGLIVPHALRMLIGADHRVLLPASIFCGAGFLIVCDTIA